MNEITVNGVAIKVGDQVSTGHVVGRVDIIRARRVCIRDKVTLERYWIDAIWLVW